MCWSFLNALLHQLPFGSFRQFKYPSKYKSQNVTLDWRFWGAEGESITWLGSKFIRVDFNQSLNSCSIQVIYRYWLGPSPSSLWSIQQSEHSVCCPDPPLSCLYARGHLASYGPRWAVWFCSMALLLSPKYRLYIPVLLTNPSNKTKEEWVWGFIYRFSVLIKAFSGDGQLKTVRMIFCVRVFQVPLRFLSARALSRLIRWGGVGAEGWGRR